MSIHPLQEQGQSTRCTDPCILVIFGATGDLTSRKLVPALYNLTRDGQLPAQFACVGFARREKTNEQFRDEMKKAVNEFSRVKPIESSLWENFQNQLFYHISEFDEDKGYESLQKLLSTLDAKFGTKGNRVYYLATQPSYFPLICQKLHQFGLIYPHDHPQKWSRVIIEKPFGHDLTSAQSLQKELLQYLSENQIYRIDHYLGKETVQNLLVFRFANSIFESLWNNRYIDHVQITVAEDIGIGSRGHFFEESGWIRDIIQNHTMQLVSLVTMEPPNSLSAEAIQNEKVKALQSIRKMDEHDLFNHVVRGQYGDGFVNGEPVVGYRKEGNVAKDSVVDTYVAMKLFIDNWRWAGVPFYIRGGKRLPKKATEIAITFKEPPSVLFQTPLQQNDANVLAIRIQPDEGIALKMNCKVPGPSNTIQPVKMDFRYGSYFGMSPPEAYERLICDCILGDSTLFTRDDEVMTSWKLITPILDFWKNHPPKDFPNYAAGSWGPSDADIMIAKDNRKWRLI